jgi:hypothetical protein
LRSAEPRTRRGRHGQAVLGAADEEFAAYFSLPHDLPKLASLLQSLRVARLHFHHVHMLPARGARPAGRRRVPYDVTLHDYYPICRNTSW